MATDRRLVIDASAGVRAAIVDGWEGLGQWQLVSPTLFWSESAAGIRQLAFRAEITATEADDAISSLLRAPVQPYASVDLLSDAFELAAALGWAKTYDAEYLALAQRLDAPFLTLDARLAATARRYVRLAI